MKVRPNALYVFDPCMWDVLDPKTNLSKGDIVRVKNLYGCPRANTMGCCHVVNMFTGEFIGLVSTGSLTPISNSTRKYLRTLAR